MRDRLGPVAKPIPPEALGTPATASEVDVGGLMLLGDGHPVRVEFQHLDAGVTWVQPHIWHPHRNEPGGRLAAFYLREMHTVSGCAPVIPIDWFKAQYPEGLKTS